MAKSKIRIKPGTAIEMGVLAVVVIVVGGVLWVGYSMIRNSKDALSNPLCTFLGIGCPSKTNPQTGDNGNGGNLAPCAPWDGPNSPFCKLFNWNCGCNKETDKSTDRTKDGGNVLPCQPWDGPNSVPCKTLGINCGCNTEPTITRNSDGTITTTADNGQKVTTDAKLDINPADAAFISGKGCQDDRLECKPYYSTCGLPIQLPNLFGCTPCDQIAKCNSDTAAAQAGAISHANAQSDAEYQAAVKATCGNKVYSPLYCASNPKSICCETYDEWKASK